MNIEIIEYYPLTKEKRKMTGTLHVYLIDFDLDIRGVFVMKKGNSWFFNLPKLYAMEDGKKVRYPVVSFANPKTYKDMLDTIIKMGKNYIKKEYLKK